MSSTVRVDATLLDGTTPVDLSDVRVNDQGAYIASVPAAGLIDLGQIDPAGVRDSYMQLYSLVAPGAVTTRVEVLLPNGDVLDITDRRFNVIVPQGALLRVEALDGLGAPVAGGITLWFWEIGSSAWPLIQECHAFSPCAGNGGGGGGIGGGRGADRTNASTAGSQPSTGGGGGSSVFVLGGKGANGYMDGPHYTF